LQQVHGIVVAHADPGVVATADASWTATPGIACTAMTADCLPALFCDRAGTRVAAAHAGWRVGGRRAGSLPRSSRHRPADVLVWLGPAIGPKPSKSVRKYGKSSSINCRKQQPAFVPEPQCRQVHG
jgi:copper oxidase (laccase) domain-containing protein